MKIFNQVEGFENKVNFVDERNTLVGYDLSRDCCEEAGWFIADAIRMERCEDQPTDGLDDYRFDPDYFLQVGGRDAKFLDGGKLAIFRLVAPSKPDLYLHIYNAHNGYYEHGFNLDVGGQTIHTGYL